MNKYLHLNKKITKLISSIREQKKKIVLCHGVFDLVHPGHIDYFKAAKSLGDILIVTITADTFIKKNMHSPYFDEQTRYNFLSNIKIIDHVFIVNQPTALPAIKKLKPDFYCKGTEYKKSDFIGNLEIFSPVFFIFNAEEYRQAGISEPNCFAISFSRLL